MARERASFRRRSCHQRELFENFHPIEDGLDARLRASNPRRIATACGTEPSLAATLAIHDANAAAQLARTAFGKAVHDERGTSRALLVTEEGAVFRLPGTGRTVDLSRRASLRRMLRALTTRRIESPGEALTLDELLAEAWPGEKINYEAATNRAYVALATLRKKWGSRTSCSASSVAIC